QALYYEIRDIFADLDTFEHYNNRTCCSTRSPALFRATTVAFSYTFSRKPQPSEFCTRKAHPMIASVTSLSLVLSVCICMHLWFQTPTSPRPSASSPPGRACSRLA